MRKEIVIARYEEPLNRWITMVPDDVDVLVYNKGGHKFQICKEVGERAVKVKTLPNVGREGHTYLTHIVDNYNDLADITFFTQGDPRPHLKGKKVSSFFAIPDPEKLVSVMTLESNRASKMYSSWRGKKPPTHLIGAINGMRWGAKRAKLSFPQWWERYVRQPFPDGESVQFSWGGTFSVTRNYILSNSKRYYKKLLSTLSSGVNPEEGHYMERAWSYIFKPNEQKNTSHHEAKDPDHGPSGLGQELPGRIGGQQT